MLHVAVIVHYALRHKSRDWMRHLLMPLIGSAVIASVLINMATPAKVAGITWLLVGTGMLLISNRPRAATATRSGS